jgi:uncharacterized protein (TIGR03067 family)
MNFTLLIVVGGLLIAADDPARRELDKHQGTWVLVSEDFQGKPVAVEKRPELSYTVRGDQLFYTSNGEERSATIKLDPTKKPKHYDVERDDGAIFLDGLYAWDGDDTIRICFASDQGDRPTEFNTAPGSPNRIRVWKRKSRPGQGT